jgi:transcriptional regulator with XRE-family HTH domain
MTWLTELGSQIRDARTLKGLSQQSLAEKTSVTREQISNIELGKSVPGVNVVTEIAAALDAEFTIRGCRIRSESLQPKVSPLPSAEQLSFVFDVEYHYQIASVRFSGTEDHDVVMNVRLAQRMIA